MWKYLTVCVLFLQVVLADDAPDDAAPPLSPVMEYKDIPRPESPTYKNKTPNKIEFHNGLVIESNAKLRGSNLRFACIIDDEEDRICAPFENIDFEGSDFSGASICGLVFRNCSFRKCDFRRTDARWGTEFHDCDFTDAVIVGSDLVLSTGQFESTASYKKRLLHNTGIHLYSDKGQETVSVNFSKCNLTRSSLWASYAINCRFDDAVIDGVLFGWANFSKEQLVTTANYKTKTLQNMSILSMDLSGVDFSNFNLTGCQFGGGSGDADFTNVDFTNAVITNCKFNYIRNPYSPGEQEFQRTLEKMDKQNRTLTVEQIKSTWNYKTGNMTGVLLPKYIQDELDKERKQNNAEAKPK